jgi:acetoin utilization deacetylase AcuC-like enzyme
MFRAVVLIFWEAQEIFCPDLSVLYVSLHVESDNPCIFFQLTCGVGCESPPDFTWSTTEKGMDNGVNANINYPLPRTVIIALPSRTLLKISRDLTPGICSSGFSSFSIANLTLIGHFISLGVDTFAEDPISNFKLSHSCYTYIGRVVAEMGKPTLFAMEG